MSVNLWLSFDVRGYAPEAEPAVRGALRALLQAEGLLEDFADAGWPEPVRRHELVAGGRCLRAGSLSPVGISGSSRFDARVTEALRAATTAAGGPATQARFRLVDADASHEDDDERRALEQKQEELEHLVTCALATRVEAARGRALAPLLPWLASLHGRLDTWEAREELLHLLLDHRTPEALAIARDFLRAPPSLVLGSSRHVTQGLALSFLDGHDGHDLAYQHDPASVARLAPLVAAGASPDEARRAELGAASPLGELAWTSRWAPYALDGGDAPALSLDAESFEELPDLLRHVEDAGHEDPSGVLLALLSLAFEDAGLAAKTERGDDRLLRVTPAGSGAAWPLVAATRRVLEDGAALAALLPRAARRAREAAAERAREREARADADPLFVLDEAGVQERYDDGQLGEDELLRLTRHPEEAVRAYLFELPDDVTRPARERLAHDPSPAVRRGAAVSCEGLSAAALAALVADPDVEVRRTLAENRDCPPDALERLAADADDGVREQVAANGSTPRACLERLATDASPDVRAWAARSLR